MNENCPDIETKLSSSGGVCRECFVVVAIQIIYLSRVENVVRHYDDDCVPSFK